MSENEKQVVSFQKTGVVSVAGIIGGVLLSIGIPWVILNYGQVLGPRVETTIVILAICLGCLIALTSAFFGLVMPSNVDGFHSHHQQHYQNWYNSKKDGDQLPKD